MGLPHDSVPRYFSYRDISFCSSICRFQPDPNVTVVAPPTCPTSPHGRGQQCLGNIYLPTPSPKYYRLVAQRELQAQTEQLQEMGRKMGELQRELHLLREREHERDRKNEVSLEALEALIAEASEESARSIRAQARDNGAAIDKVKTRSHDPVRRNLGSTGYVGWYFLSSRTKIKKKLRRKLTVVLSCDTYPTANQEQSRTSNRAAGSNVYHYNARKTTIHTRPQQNRRYNHTSRGRTPSVLHCCNV